MTTYLQGRLPAPTRADAIAAIRARVEAQGYEPGEIRVWAGPVQCWAGVVWWEYLAEGVERDTDTF